MTVTQTRRNAVVVCSAVYYDEIVGYHVFKIQLRYVDLNAERNRFQLITFKFSNEDEVKRCVEEFKAVFNLDSLVDINNKPVSVLLYEERNYKNEVNSELVSMCTGEKHGKIWYPMGCGLADKLSQEQMLYFF